MHSRFDCGIQQGTCWTSQINLNEQLNDRALIINWILVYLSEYRARSDKFPMLVHVNNIIGRNDDVNFDGPKWWSDWFVSEFDFERIRLISIERQTFKTRRIETVVSNKVVRKGNPLTIDHPSRLPVFPPTDRLQETNEPQFAGGNRRPSDFINVSEEIGRSGGKWRTKRATFGFLINGPTKCYSFQFAF